MDDPKDDIKDEELDDPFTPGAKLHDHEDDDEIDPNIVSVDELIDEEEEEEGFEDEDEM